MAASPVSRRPPEPDRVTHVLYLHGFRSSPRSFKAQLLERALAEQRARGLPTPQWFCPQLPPSPAQAWAEITALTAGWPRERMVVIGSSLGGFYATALAESTGCRAAVINPAVAPARDLARYIGEQTTFHDPEARFFFRPEFIPELEAISPYPITLPRRYWALLAKGDEVLDWQEMAAHYPATALTLLPGSDHAVSDFEQHMPALLRWLAG